MGKATVQLVGIGRVFVDTDDVWVTVCDGVQGAAILNGRDRCVSRDQRHEAEALRNSERYTLVRRGKDELFELVGDVE